MKILFEFSSHTCINTLRRVMRELITFEKKFCDIMFRVHTKLEIKLNVFSNYLLCQLIYIILMYILKKMQTKEVNKNYKTKKETKKLLRNYYEK